MIAQNQYILWESLEDDFFWIKFIIEPAAYMLIKAHNTTATPLLWEWYANTKFKIQDPSRVWFDLLLFITLQIR